MQAPPPNKMMAAKGYVCPSCGARDRPGCRSTLNGPYCRQHGLLFDYSLLLTTAPDPLAEKVRVDPEAVAAQLLEREAQNAYDTAEAAWEAALGELASVRLKAAGDRGEFGEHGWRPTRAVKKLRLREGDLSTEVDRLEEERELLGKLLMRARVATRVASDAARLRAGGAIQQANTPSPVRHVIP